MLARRVNSGFQFYTVKPVAVLYITFFSFLMSVFIRTNEFAYGEYLSTFICIFAMLTALYSYKSRLVFPHWQILLFIFVALISFVLLLKGKSHYTAFLYLKIMMMIFFFTTYKISNEEFIAFVNKTYVMYLAASILVWIGVMPNIFYSYIISDEFYANFVFFGFNILYGIEGSPALIDTYSAFVLLVNIFWNKHDHRLIFILCAAIGLLASFRMTPMVALVGVLLLYPIYKRSKYMAIAMLLVISLFFLMLIIALYTDASVKLIGEDTDLRLMAYSATHARSMIWVQQLEYMINHYSWLDYIFGRYSVAEFTVQTFQINGLDAGRETPNPHNNYLLLFFRSPLLFCLFMVIFIVAQFKTYEAKTFPLILLVFLASFTNSSLIGLGNPVYLLLIVYVATQARNGLSAKSRERRGGVI